MFDHIFQPGMIGKLEVKNRLIKPAQHLGTASYTTGFVSETQLNYYRDWARGGAGLVIVEMAAIDYVGAAELPGMIMIGSDDAIPGLTNLANILKENGAAAGIQVCHGGGCKVGRPSFGPSKFPYVNVMGMKQDCEEMTGAQIEEAIENYGQAALRAKKAGFEMVEIHMAHGYLPDAFYSPKYNLRTDE